MINLTIETLGYSVTRKLNKILRHFFEKVTQKAKIFTSKLNLKAQNIYIKPLLKPLTFATKCVETACEFENLVSKK
jgi:hypothetical protein